MFAADDEPLEDAMTRKMDLALDAIEVKPGDHVLEVGGGWGAFAEHAARRGIEVTDADPGGGVGALPAATSFEPRAAAGHVVRQHFFGYESAASATTRSSTWA